MAGHRKDMLDIQRIIQLKAQGESNRSIGRLLGINRKTVNEYVQALSPADTDFGELVQLDQEALAAKLPSPKISSKPESYQILQSLIPTFQKDLKKPGFTYLSIWQDYRSKHPDGYGYTQFKEHLQKAFALQDASFHMEQTMGEKLLVDYAGDRLELTDRNTGLKQPVELFVAVLAGSGYTYVEASESQQKACFLTSMRYALEFIGGVPRMIVTDNLKAAVTRAHRYEPELNKDFKAFALHYNTAVLATRARKPKDKALVENAVKLVYQRICFQLKDQVFFDLASLNQAIRPLLERYNERMYQQRQISRKQLFLEQEQGLLAPLPEQAYWLLAYKQVKVQKNYHVFLSEDKHYYSVPYQHIGKKVELRYSATIVEIYYANKRIASHVRSKKAAGFSTHQAHMPEHHQYMQGWNTASFLEWALSKDQLIYNYVEKVFALRAHPEQAYRSCWGIQRLGKIYGTERLKSACQRAMLFEQYGYKVLESILKKNLDVPVVESTKEHCLPQHENLRGATYYS
jgi:transposase